jgi:hypothetical protein
MRSIAARQIVFLFVHSEFRLSNPIFSGVLMLAEFLLQHVLVGDRDGDLRFHLQVLIFHIADHLLDHFFRIFRAIDHVVEICAD